ncbi:hypothetical protein LTR62_007529 [Meristemomyces frigidus]|uniref:Uncharacterized protein n=1 Tax=Meristemomyces frigidus TaxID=1508187 RepID=A0AAN7TBI4_9PEZI|nr:hypothetical protein LTR62_007529 [Meristemomyces frigidus]
MVNLLNPKTWRRSGRSEEPHDTRCCIEERNLWRQIARRNNLIPPLSTTMQVAKPPSKLKRRSTVKQTSTPHPFNLLALPLELREEIYTFYLLDHATVRLTPFQLPPIHTPGLDANYYYKPLPPHDPALLLTSRQIRTEALKVFYSTYRFPVIIHFPNPEEENHRGACDTDRIPWYHHLDPSKLKLIRHFELFYCFEADLRRLGVRQADAYILHLDLDPRRGGYELRVVESLGLLTRRGVAQKRGISGVVRGVLDEIIGRAGVGGVTVQDLERFVPRCCS